MKNSSNRKSFIIFYSILIFIFVFFGIFLYNWIAENSYVGSVIFSFLMVILFLIFYKIFMGPMLQRPSEGDLFRYSMSCKNCNWEWMSNTTENKTPSKCPNCGEKRSLELIGWRRVQHYQDQKNQELTKFLKK